MDSTGTRLDKSVARSSRARSRATKKVSKRNEGLRNCRDSGSFFLQVDRIEFDPVQARRIGREETDGLDASIEEIGILQPIKVRWNEESERYVVVVGERRLRAAIEAKQTEVPVTFGNQIDSQAVVVQLAENNLKKSMHAVDTMRAVMTLLESGRSQVQIVRATGISEPVVSKAKRISALPERVIKAATAIPDLSVNRLYQVVGLPVDEQIAAIEQLQDGDSTAIENPTRKKTRKRVVKKRYQFTASNGVTFKITPARGAKLNDSNAAIIEAIAELQDAWSAGENVLRVA